MTELKDIIGKYVNLKYESLHIQVKLEDEGIVIDFYDEIAKSNHR
jgi:hypothetical protein